MDRELRFGKYKGEPIKKIILEHMGYIIWCLSNINGFFLTQEEQALYDALAIANIKYGIKMVFPDDIMLANVKDKEKLANRETPFIVRGDGMIRYKIKDSDDPIIASVIAYKQKRKQGLNYLPELCQVANKIVSDSYSEWIGVDYDDF